MPYASSSAETQLPPAAGFWIRLLAHVLDSLIWAVTVGVLAFGLTLAAPNLFGMAQTLPNERRCQRLPGVPEGAPAFRHVWPNLAAHCVRSVAGVRFREDVVLIQQWRDGSVWRSRSVTYPVGPDLKPKAVFELDGIVWGLFLGYVTLAQGRYGTTLGKHILRLKVIGSNGGAPGLKAAFVRNVVLLGPLMAILVLGLAAAIFDVFFAWERGLLWFLGLGPVVLAMTVQIWWTATHERPSIHDRIAGTRVARVRWREPIAGS